MSDIEDNEPDAVRRRRGIYVLPNLFTTAALFAGFYAIVMGVGGRYEEAAIAMFVAMVLDGADGRIARLTNTESDFGAQYDSLSDVVSFGLAPALVVYQWCLEPLGKLGWVAAFFYAATTALRLARFNTQLGVSDKRYFQGLPCPAAAAVIAGFLWVGVEHEFEGTRLSVVALILMVSTGALMVSNVRYNSFKEFDLKGRVPFVFALACILGFALVSLDPPVVLFAVFFGYAVSGPVMTLVQIRQRRAERLAEHARTRTKTPD
jgi:CDP-diacylglycerol--serine O-phosphatidyltransferase